MERDHPDDGVGIRHQREFRRARFTQPEELDFLNRFGSVGVDSQLTAGCIEAKKFADVEMKKRC